MSFIAETRERRRPSLPLTALVDVLFLLLIVFIALPALIEAEPSARSETSREPAAAVTELNPSADDEAVARDAQP